MSGLFTTFIYQPILSVLIFIYENLVFHDLGLAIIGLTLLVRIVLYPLFYKSTKDQTLMQRLQPHIKKIQLDHKDNKDTQVKALLALYKEHRLNPFSGFLILIVQLPIFIALFRIFTKELGNAVFDSHTLLGLINLGEASFVITILAAFLQYVQARLTLPQTSNTDTGLKSAFASTGKMMMYFGPLLTLLVLSRLPSALGLYWTTSTLFSIAQQWYINKKLPALPSEK